MEALTPMVCIGISMYFSPLGFLLALVGSYDLGEVVFLGIGHTYYYSRQNTPSPADDEIRVFSGEGGCAGMSHRASGETHDNP